MISVSLRVNEEYLLPAANISNCCCLKCMWASKLGKNVVEIY